jgi:N-formylglutamate amidohydrolase
MSVSRMTPDAVHSVQIEINRGLYLDKATVAPGSGFARLRNYIAQLTRRLVEAARRKP